MIIDELTERQLDGLIAQQVFGLEVEERTNARTGAKDIVCRAPGGEWHRTPTYAISVHSRIDVGLALRHRGWTQIDQPDLATGQVQVTLEHKDGRVVQASGSPGEALCRAALKACAAP
jgi:hypothetical protein